MPKRLFTVDVEVAIVVVADSESEAEEIARRAVRVEDGAEVDTMAFETNRLPPDWDMECVPFGAADGQTIGQWIEAGAAPKLKKD